MTEDSKILSVDGLSVSYHGVPALQDVSLSIERGAITTIVGSNGAGKTTLMKAIAGLLVPDSGDVRLYGKDINGQTPAEMVQAGVTLVPEGRRLFGQLSVRENLMTGAYIRNDRAAIAADFETVLGYFPALRDRLSAPASALSGGQQQMLAVGRALMTSPKLVMLDEPTIGLAPAVVDTICDIVETISRNGVEVLLVEQNAHIALELAAQAYVMENGRIVLEGSGKDLLHNDLVREAYLGL
ncbi:ABC transporter ATP-binding protein [Pseudooceanicola sp.]|uniref:ABC transporter ATP-binding protein n=1 Tax=Pseudooceanicola sp. TaxID=1914328 RepID=UPI000C0B4F6C|nr:ABC transporter ATP-binding protein [Pseudooceanicola sp.]|tara:strand:- start:9668 stop:10390 length:723 start_codon:yes stop_codon:yes gene_type:complete